MDNEVKEKMSNINLKPIIVVVGLKNSGNLGAIARSCDNFNVDKLILIAPKCKVDDEAYERATKARRYLDNIIILNNLNEVRKYADILIALSARKGGSRNLSRSSIPIQLIEQQINNVVGNIAFVLGRENFGLTNSEINQCDFISYIPVPGLNPVLNISHATTLVLWEFVRSESVNNAIPHRLMSNNEKSAFFKYLHTILPHTWINKEKFNGIIRVFSSILGRSLVTQREASALIGTLRGIARSLEENHPPWDDCNDK